MVKKSDTYYEILGVQRNRPKGMDVFNDDSPDSLSVANSSSLVDPSSSGENGLNGGQANDVAGTARQLTPVDSSLEGAPASEVRELNGAEAGKKAVNGGLNADGSNGVDGLSGQSGQNVVDVSHPLGKINRILGADPLGSAEEQARRRKREKRERLFSALGDGISALSNLYYTTRYAPNAYNVQNSQSKVVGDRWDRLNKERAANHKAWVNAAIGMEQNDTLNRIRQQNADANQAYRERESQRKADEAEVKKKAQEIKNAKEQAYTDWVKERAKGQGAMDEAKIEYYKTKIDCLERGMSIKEAESKAKIAEMESRTRLNNRRGSGGSGKGGSSKGGSSKGKYYGTFRGKSYQTAADYNKAVSDAADSEGVSKTETYKGGIGGTVTSTRARKVNDIAADIEARDRAGTSKYSQQRKARTTGRKHGGGNRGGGSSGVNKTTKNKHVQALGW